MSPRPDRAFLVASLVATWAAGVGVASAQGTASGGDPALAESLFADAKRLMAAGDFADACPKLAESNRLDPGSGTLTALAVCHENWGKTATAWADFIQVASEAKRVGRPDRERFAQQHVAALERRLSKLVIVVDPANANLPGLEVRRDGVMIGPPAWGMASPVDPGEHTLVATANGKKTWSTSVSIRRLAGVDRVSVPPLEDLPEASRPPIEGSAHAPADSASAESASDAVTSAARTARPSSGGRSQRAVGLVVGALGGAVSASLGTYFGLRALSKSHQANQRCSSASCTDPGAVSLNSDAKSAALVADVAFGAALVFVGLGAALYVTAPSPPASDAAVRLVPVAAERGGFLILDAAW